MAPFSKGGIFLAPERDSLLAEPSSPAPSSPGTDVPTAPLSAPATLPSATYAGAAAAASPCELRQQRRASMSELRRDMAVMYESEGERGKQAFEDMARFAAVQYERNNWVQQHNLRTRRVSENVTVSGSKQARQMPTQSTRRLSMPVVLPQAAENGNVKSPRRSEVQRSLMAPLGSTPPSRSVNTTATSSSPTLSRSRPSRHNSRIVDFALLSPAIDEIEGDVAEAAVVEMKPLTPPHAKYALLGQRTASPTALVARAMTATSTVIPAAGQSDAEQPSAIGMKRRSSLTLLLRRVTKFCSRRRR